MAAVLTAYNEPYGKDFTAAREYLHGLLAFTGSYTTGGILPSYSTIKDQSGANVLLNTLNVNPDTLWIQSIAGSGYTYQYVKSSGKIMILTTGSAAGSPAQELAAGALPAGVTGDTIEFESEWVKQ